MQEKFEQVILNKYNFKSSSPLMFFITTIWGLFQLRTRSSTFSSLTLPIFPLVFLLFLSLPYLKRALSTTRHNGW